MKIKNFIVIVVLLCVFLISCIYLRTGYFESSITTNQSTFYLKSGDSITTQRYYRDLSGNWILLDKNVVIPSAEWSATSISTN